MIAILDRTYKGGIYEYSAKLAEMLGVELHAEDPDLPEGEARYTLLQYHHTVWTALAVRSVLSKIEEGDTASIMLHDQHFSDLLPTMLGQFDNRFVLSRELEARIPDATYIAPPCLEKSPMLLGFGEWRNNHDRNAAACALAGCQYDGEPGVWDSTDDFKRRLNACDGVILSYCEADAICWASSLATALSTHKPVFLSNIRHFASAPQCSTVFKHETKDELVNQLKDVYRMPYMEEHDWLKHSQSVKAAMLPLQ